MSKLREPTRRPSRRLRSRSTHENPPRRVWSRRLIGWTLSAKPALPSFFPRSTKVGRCLPTLYDDGGFSGGNWTALGFSSFSPTSPTARSTSRRLQDRPVYALAVDFAKIVEVFDAAGVTFVSITQQFNTTTSMGRLTLNVLLSFAQFEREVTGERIRDKIAASKKKGMWMGGLPPLATMSGTGSSSSIEEEARPSSIYSGVMSNSDRCVSSRRTGCCGNPQQTPHLRRRHGLWRSQAFPRRPLPYATEPHLSRQDHAQRQCLSRRA